jgi:polyhydroxyalkanoate synthase subunit PhaC
VPSLDVADTSKAFAAAVAPWTKAVADITKMQMDMLQQMAALWLAAMPAAASTTEPIKDRRFAGEAWTKDPRFAAVARIYLTQAELMQKALDAAPIDERSKAQWGFALRHVMNALSPANTLVTNPEALQLAMGRVEGAGLSRRRAGRCGVRAGADRATGVADECCSARRTPATRQRGGGVR